MNVLQEYSQQYVDRLTPAQERVARALVKGLLNKQICHELGMSEGTVKVHLKNLMRKHGARNRLALALMLVGAIPAGGVMAPHPPPGPAGPSETCGTSPDACPPPHATRAGTFGVIGPPVERGLEDCATG